MRRPRLLCDRVEAHVRALQALGINSESYGKLLTPLFLEKLPLNMRLIISRTVDQPKWDLDVLLNAFDNEIEARELCEPIGTNPIDPLINQSEESVTCTFCKQGNSSASCVLSPFETRGPLLYLFTSQPFGKEGRICSGRHHM